MRLKPNAFGRWLRRYGTAIAATVMPLAAVSIASTAPVIPFDEPPCYMRTRDGNVVNLESLCRRSPIAPTQTTPTDDRQPGAPSQRSNPQMPTIQVSRPAKTSGSHVQGNPDSDDGRY